MRAWRAPQSVGLPRNRVAGALVADGSALRFGAAALCALAAALATYGGGSISADGRRGKVERRGDVLTWLFSWPSDRL